MFDSYVVPGRVLQGHGSDLAAGVGGRRGGVVWDISIAG